MSTFSSSPPATGDAEVSAEAAALPRRQRCRKRWRYPSADWRPDVAAADGAAAEAAGLVPALEPALEHPANTTAEMKTSEVIRLNMKSSFLRFEGLRRSNRQGDRDRSMQRSTQRRTYDGRASSSSILMRLLIRPFDS